MGGSVRSVKERMKEGGRRCEGSQETKEATAWLISMTRVAVGSAKETVVGCMIGEALTIPVHGSGGGGDGGDGGCRDGSGPALIPDAGSLVLLSTLPAAATFAAASTASAAGRVGERVVARRLAVAAVEGRRALEGGGEMSVGGGRVKRAHWQRVPLRKARYRWSSSA